MDSQEKGRKFEGIYGGASYDRMAAIMGMRSKFYHKVIGDIMPQPRSRILDLGCGTGSLGVAFSISCDGMIEVDGVDISDDQLNHARKKADKLKGAFTYHNCSMDELHFDDNRFDIVVSSMALHETPSLVRRKAISEVSRVLKDDGRFILVEWAKPKLGFMGLVWLPFLFFGEWRDNWNNSYLEICEANGFERVGDQYLNSLIRRQEFVKA